MLNIYNIQTSNLFGSRANNSQDLIHFDLESVFSIVNSHSSPFVLRLRAKGNLNSTCFIRRGGLSRIKNIFTVMVLSSTTEQKQLDFFMSEAATAECQNVAR